jgi:hypothetical protein
MSGLAGLLPSLVLNTISPPSHPPPPSSASQNKNIHALTILSRILADPEMAIKNPNRIDAIMMYAHPLKTHAERIRGYAEQWTVDIGREGEVEGKIEELVWMNVVLYAVGGWGKDRPFKASFFLYVLP